MRDPNYRPTSAFDQPQQDTSSFPWRLACGISRRGVLGASIYDTKARRPPVSIALTPTEKLTLAAQITAIRYAGYAVLWLNRGCHAPQKHLARSSVAIASDYCGMCMAGSLAWLICLPRGPSHRTTPTMLVFTSGICCRRNGLQRPSCTAANLSCSCPLWVKSRHCRV